MEFHIQSTFCRGETEAVAPALATRLVWFRGLLDRPKQNVASFFY